MKIIAFTTMSLLALAGCATGDRSSAFYESTSTTNPDGAWQTSQHQEVKYTTVHHSAWDDWNFSTGPDQVATRMNLDPMFLPPPSLDH